MVKAFIVLFWFLISPWLWNTIRTPLEVRLDPVWKASEVEITQINFYRGAYEMNRLSRLMGKASLNKVTMIWGHVMDRFFGYVDPNFYFFSNHPRERVGEKEISRLHSWSLILFIVGFIKMIKSGLIKKWLVFFVLVNLIISMTGMNGSWIELSFFPLMIYVLTTGSLYVLDKK